MDQKYFQTGHLKAHLGRDTVRGGVATFIGQGFTFALNFISTIILARLLSPDDYGLISMVAPVMCFVGFFRDLGLSTATVQQSEITDQQVSNLFWLNLLLAGAVMVVSIVLAPVLAVFYHRPEVTWIAMAYAFNFVITGLSIQHAALLRRQMDFGFLTKAGLVATGLSIAFALIGAFYGLSYWAIVIMPLVNSLVFVLMVWNRCSWRPKRPVRGAGIRSMVAFGGWLTGGNLLYALSSSLDSVLIGRFLGSVPLGHYNRANQLFTFSLQQVIAPLSAVVVPALSRLQDEPERYRKAFLNALGKLALITMPVSSVFIASGDLLVIGLLGPKWTEAAGLIRILAMGGIVLPISSALSWILISQGRAKSLMLWNIVSLTILIPSLGIGLQWGLKGVAVGIVIKSFLGFLLFTPWACSRGSVKSGDVYRKIFLPVACAAGGLGVALALRQAAFPIPVLVQAGFLGVTGLVTSLGLCLLLPAGRESVREVMTLVRGLVIERFPILA